MSEHLVGCALISALILKGKTYFSTFFVPESLPEALVAIIVRTVRLDCVQALVSRTKSGDSIVGKPILKVAKPASELAGAGCEIPLVPLRIPMQNVQGSTGGSGIPDHPGEGSKRGLSAWRCCQERQTCRIMMWSSSEAPSWGLR